ncbi:unnamed protein product [Staurois parvus]|uniref:Uncharacterized protein n=1 Tax=Staurois parvus TaxID=386267 RepID=A0ABN9FG44_9NEOB|nr:unnamed protein product [Staurois parvus]
MFRMWQKLLLDVIPSDAQEDTPLGRSLSPASSVGKDFLITLVLSNIEEATRGKNLILASCAVNALHRLIN